MSETGTVTCQAPQPSALAPGALIGVPAATLQAWRLAAQTALQALMTGQSAVGISYAEGQGHRQVRYVQADVGKLHGWIAELNRALGVRTRRAIGVRF